MVQPARPSSCAGTAGRARDRFLSDGHVDGVRQEILASWRRSRLLGADPSQLRPPYEPASDMQSPLLSAASPVLARLSEQLSGEDVALILSDSEGRIVARRTGEHDLLRTLDHLEAAVGFVYSEDATGTNGLGTAIETRRPIEVVGADHFAERLTNLTCVGVPIIHPITQQLAGVMDITCYAARTNGLLLPLVSQAAGDIAERLGLQRSIAERALLLQFQRAARASSHGILAVGDRCVMSTPAASRLLAGIDRGVLWEWAGQAVYNNAANEQELDIPGACVLRVHIVPVHDGGTPIGALIEVRPTRCASETDSASGDSPGRSPPGLIGHSTVWRRCCERAWRAAQTTEPIVLAGEPGVGKTVLATALHRTLWNNDAALVIVDGDTARLQGETAWLSTIQRQSTGAAPGTLLVRNLQSLRPSLIRVLRSTAADLQHRGWRFIGTEVRLPETRLSTTAVNGRVIEVPPLRERLADLPALVADLTTRSAAATGRHREIDAEVVQFFQRLTWPGNIAQLARTIDGVLAEPTTAPVRITELPAELLQTVARRQLTRLECAEIHTILATLREMDGNRKEAAKILQISRTTLYRKLRCAGIDLARVTF